MQNIMSDPYDLKTGLYKTNSILYNEDNNNAPPSLIKESSIEKLPSISPHDISPSSLKSLRILNLGMPKKSPTAIKMPLLKIHNSMNNLKKPHFVNIEKNMNNNNFNNNKEKDEEDTEDDEFPLNKKNNYYMPARESKKSQLDHLKNLNEVNDNKILGKNMSSSLININDYQSNEAINETKITKLPSYQSDYHIQSSNKRDKVSNIIGMLISNKSTQSLSPDRKSFISPIKPDNTKESKDRNYTFSLKVLEKVRRSLVNEIKLMNGGDSLQSINKSKKKYNNINQIQKVLELKEKLIPEEEVKHISATKKKMQNEKRLNDLKCKGSSSNTYYSILALNNATKKRLDKKLDEILPESSRFRNLY